MTDEPREDDRLQSLEVAVLALTVNVQDLVQALTAVGDLTVAQREQTAKQTLTDTRAASALATSQARFRRLNAVQRWSAVSVIVLVCLGPLLAYFLLTQRVNAQFVNEQNIITASCEKRNETGVRQPAAREQKLADLYLARKDMALAKLHQSSADVISQGIIDCSIYRAEK